MIGIAQGRAKVSRKTRWKARDLAVLTLSGQAALRVGEVAALRIGDLERIGEGILYVRTLKLRGSERGCLDESLVDQGVQVALQRYCRALPPEVRQQDDHPLFYNERTGRGLSRRAIQNVWALYARAAGVHKSIHAGRHLAATEAVRVGGLKFAKRKLRHRALSSTLAYQDIDFETERQLLEQSRIV